MKTITKIGILVFAFIFSFSLTSCNDNLDNVNDVVLSPANPNNPYDYIGEMHNQALSLVMNHYDNTDKTTTKEMNSLVEQYSYQVTSMHTQTRGTTIDQLDTMTEEEVLELLADCDNNLVNFISSLSISSESKEKLTEIFSFVLESADDPDVTHEKLNFKIVEFENNYLEIMNSEGELDENDNLTVLAGTSTLRHSLSYWEPIMIDESAATRGRKWWQWVIIAVADAGGALAGASGGPATAVSCGVSASSFANTLMK